MYTILALYPNYRGLNYACLDMPNTLLDYGIVSYRPFTTDRFLKRIDKFITYYRPKVVILRDIAPDTFQGKYAVELAESISTLASSKNLPVHTYTRKQVKDVFKVHGAGSKHEIAKLLASWIPDLQPHTPAPRKLYLPEDHRMGIFDAVSLAVAHDYLTE